MEPPAENSRLPIGEHPMALDVFLLIDCLGLAFLIYVLVNFRKESRGQKYGRYMPFRCEERDFGVRIATIPAVCTSKDQNSVIPFPTRNRHADYFPEQQRGFTKPVEMQRRGVAEARVSHGGK
jgi:hypothetical protein